MSLPWLRAANDRYVYFFFLLLLLLQHTVAKHNSMFAGYEQLDSQEFLLILLDTLHEDLNKVRST